MLNATANWINDKLGRFNFFCTEQSVMIYNLCAFFMLPFDFQYVFDVQSVCIQLLWVNLLNSWILFEYCTHYKPLWYDFYPNSILNLLRCRFEAILSLLQMKVKGWCVYLDRCYPQTKEIQLDKRKYSCQAYWHICCCEGRHLTHIHYRLKTVASFIVNNIRRISVRFKLIMYF